MISEHIENKELIQIIPIRTINDTVEWTEEILQPWELNGEFTWPEEGILENPIPMMNIIQEDKRIIELQNHIAKLENEIAIKDQLNEGLRIQLDEKQYELNETARMCNENATMVMNAQEWMKYFKNKYDRRNKRVNELKKRGNILLTKYVDKNNDLKDRVEELEQEINFGNILFNQMVDLNMTISSEINIDPSIENMELLKY
jgi:cell division septum initiation protein DivIVA